MIHLPTMCEYCYRARMICAVAVGVAIGAICGQAASIWIGLSLVLIAAIVAYVLPALSNG